jgi:hypothetical protein
MHTHTQTTGEGAATRCRPTAGLSRKREIRMTTRSIRTLRPRYGRACAAVGVALVLALVLAPGAGAQQFTWHSPITLEDTGGTQGADAVACPSATQCTAVDAIGQQVTFNPTDGSTKDSSAVDVLGRVSRVSCPSVSQCTAVDNLGHEVTFDPGSGAILYGGLRSVETNLAPNAPSTPLSSVSCATSSFCVAVDNAGNAYSFDPATGTSDGGTSVDGTTALNAVACKSNASLCVAVDSLGNEISIAYPGASASSHSSGSSHSLTGVSCNAAFSSCTAVDDHGQEVTFAPGSGGGTPIAVDGTNPLTAVSCASDYSQCTAVDQTGNETTFAPGAGGSPQVVDGITLLSDVACPAGTDTQCTAVDNQGNEVTFNPTTGTHGPAHSVVANVLASLSCPTATQCTAVEAGEREITFDPTTQSITGQDGNGSTGPSRIDTTGNPLVSVSCPTATECTAVDQGAFKTTFNPQTGRPNAAGTSIIDNGQSLQAVSCPIVGQCTAVDTHGVEVTFDPALGSDGVNPTSPNVIDQRTDNLLVAVDCTSQHQCVAVDRGGNEITFDPTTGNAPASTNPATPTTVDPGQHPTSLSCASGTQCTAVDDSGRAATFDPTTITTTQNDSAGPTSVDGTTPLASVSCPSSTACVAADGGGNAVQFDPSTLTGSTVEPVPQAAALTAVSCNTPYECAVADAGGSAFAGFLPPASSAPPTITGTAQQGQTLTEHHGTWANYPASSYTIQWENCDDSGCSAIPGATGSTYVLQPSDVGERIAVQETATNLGGASQPATSAQTSVVLPLPPANQGPPTIVGTVAQGQTLTEQHGHWTGNPSGYAVQWQDCDGAGHNCTAISGATGQSYEPQTSDVGKTLVVTETASNSGGMSSAAPSAHTAPVPAARAANILAVTDAQSSVTWQSALLHGITYTQGAPASWQFQYGTTTALGRSTPVQVVAAGNNSEIPAQWAVSNLKPATTYYFRLVETVSPGTYRSGVQSLGRVLRFTTPLVGTLHLKSTQLPVKRGHAALSLGCRAPVDCTAQLGVSVTHWTGKGRHRHRQLLRCAATRAAVPRNGRRSLSLSLKSSCVALLHAARHHVIAAQLVAVSTSGQSGLSQGVELRG